MSRTLPTRSIKAFQQKIYDNYDRQGRKFPWRKNLNPYRVLVSEIMLQQTQVERVIDKFKQFLTAFPDFRSLADAPTAQLLSIWSGMGYNRRALSLQALAKQVMTDHRGRLPNDQEKLLTLPGIGNYTAGAVMAFAFNKPVVFMDTNIRRVFIHEFFSDKSSIRDDDLYPHIEKTLDRENPRKWYNALMDYGAQLKREQVNPNRRSAHYCRQSTFENSNRQVRGKILKALVQESPLTAARIVNMTAMDADRVRENLIQLEREGFLKRKGRSFFL